MTPKKSFFVILRIVFVLFSLTFIKDAFYKWDGYSYYMRFMDFLPELSLAFILWTVLGIILAFFLWLIVYGLYKLFSGLFKNIRIEHIILWFILIPPLLLAAVLIKGFLLENISLRNATGLSHASILLIGCMLVILVVWLIRRYSESIIYGIDTRITPVVWIFILLLIIAVPFSILGNGNAGASYTENENAPVLSPDKKRPNIILVLWDTLTVRDMQSHGYERATTPFISKWVKDAVVFNKAYASSNWTTPSVMSLMTGQRPWTHGVWYQAIYHPVDNYENNFPRILRENGYDIYGYVQNRFAHPDTLGIGKYFLKKDKASSFWVPGKWWFSNFYSYFPVNSLIVKNWIFGNPVFKKINSFRPHEEVTNVPPEMIYDSFLEYISQKRSRNSMSGRTGDPADKPERPFFAWLHVFPPHEYYLPPEPYMGLYGDEGKFNSNKKQKESNLLSMEYGPEKQAEVDILRKRYDEFIVYSDNQFELFLSRLAETVDMSNTIIIFTSDHGESFSSGFQGHIGEHLYEPIVHIPFIIKMPGDTKGKVMDMPVEQIDITPTIFELAGIPVPEWIEGRSLLPLFADLSHQIDSGNQFQESITMERRPVFSMQFLKNRALGHKITRGTIAVWDGDYKMIYYLEDNRKLLFNLKSDPDETHNIFQDKPEIAKELLELIDDNLSRANARITKLSEK